MPSVMKLDPGYIETLKANYLLVAGQTELGPGYAPDRFCGGNGKSTYAFGNYQFDVGKNAAAANFLLGVGFTAAEIRSLSQNSTSNPIDTTVLNALNLKLREALNNPVNASAYAALNSMHANDLVGQLQVALDKIYDVNPSIANKIYADQATQLALLDYANQFTLDASGALVAFLKGLPPDAKISSDVISDYIMNRTLQGTNPLTHASELNREIKLQTEIFLINPSHTAIVVFGNAIVSGSNVQIGVVSGANVILTGSNDTVTMGAQSTVTNLGGVNDTFICGSSSATIDGTASLTCSPNSLGIVASGITGSVATGSSVTLAGSGNLFTMGANSSVSVSNGVDNTLTCNGVSETVSGTGSISCTAGGFTNSSGLSIGGAGPEPTPEPGDGGNSGGGDAGGSGGGGGCVAIESFLPDGRRAGDIRIEDEMDLADEKTLAAARGVVSYSQRKTQPGWRIVTQSGVSLRCSASAPIPTPEGLVLAPDLLGKQVAVRRDDGRSLGGAQTAWETVESVQAIGDIEVQHITVGDRCFWAGEVAGAFILHHNMKDSGGGGGGGGGGEDDPPWWWGDLHSGEPGGPSGVGRPVAANSAAVVATASPAAVAPVSASAPQAQALIQAMAGFSAPAADAGLGRSLRDRSVSEQLLSPLP